MGNSSIDREGVFIFSDGPHALIAAWHDGAELKCFMYALPVDDCERIGRALLQRAEIMRAMEPSQQRECEVARLMAMPTKAGIV